MATPDLTPQIPGEPLGTITPLANNAAADSTDQADKSDPVTPLFVAKHSAGGRWWVVTNDDKHERVGDFVGDKESIKAEVDRMNAGGEPLVLDGERLGDRAALEKAKPSAVDIDPTSIKQPVMTPDGWLCPEVAPKE